MNIDHDYVNFHTYLARMLNLTIDSKSEPDNM